MPLLSPPILKPPAIQFNGQLQTLVPGIFRNPKFPGYQRERLELEDGDFLDLDWISNQSRSLFILSHGLEGNSSRPYVTGLASYLSAQGNDVLAWNCRSCSEQMNRLPKLYHHGEIEDIGIVISHALTKGNYDKIWLAGFSMGANISLNYLCKKNSEIPEQIQGAIVCSAPVDLHEGALQLETKEGAFYRWRFFKLLQDKLMAKERQFPGWIDTDKFKAVKKWEEFDRWFSAPINGFKDELDFYHNASPIHFFDQLNHPVLLVNAKNDPLLGDKCYPMEAAKNNVYLHYMEPEQGGHVGFAQRGSLVSWFEEVAYRWISDLNGDGPKS